MRKLLGLAFVLVAATLAGSAPLAAAAPKAPAARDWATTTSVTPQGAFVLGNPAAKVKVVEYLSLTCPHCAHLAGESLGPLKANYIAKGLVSLEVRHALRDSLDFSGSILARCNGPKSFFPALETMFARQDEWVEAAIKFQQADNGATAKLPLPQALAAISHGAGLDRIMAGYGLPAARVNACFADKKEQDRLGDMAKEAWETRHIPGTPAFLVNGALADGVTSWATLEAKIKDALK